MNDGPKWRICWRLDTESQYNATNYIYATQKQADLAAKAMQRRFLGVTYWVEQEPFKQNRLEDYPRGG